MFNSFPDMMTVSDLQTALGIGRNSAYALVRDKKIKSLKIGRNIRIPKAWLIEYIQNGWYNDNCNGLVVNGGVI